MTLGMNASTGASLDGLDHLRQSIRNILVTPVGSCVMRRDYGSRLFELVDQTLTPLVSAQIYAATVDALRKWEPRLRVTRVQAEATTDDLEQGQLSLTIEGQYLPDGQDIRLDGIVL